MLLGILSGCLDRAQGCLLAAVDGERDVILLVLVQRFRRKADCVPLARVLQLEGQRLLRVEGRLRGM